MRSICCEVSSAIELQSTNSGRSLAPEHAAANASATATARSGGTIESTIEHVRASGVRSSTTVMPAR
jgi:hypothetical protein